MNQNSNLSKDFLNFEMKYPNIDWEIHWIQHKRFMKNSQNQVLSFLYAIQFEDKTKVAIILPSFEFEEFMFPCYQKENSQKEFAKIKFLEMRYFNLNEFKNFYEFH